LIGGGRTDVGAGGGEIVVVPGGIIGGGDLIKPEI